MKHTIHVHQAEIRKGNSAIIDRTYKGSIRTQRLDIICPSCQTVAATVVQSAVPDSCGARVWIEAQETASGLKVRN